MLSLIGALAATAANAATDRTPSATETSTAIKSASAYRIVTVAAASRVTFRGAAEVVLSALVTTEEGAVADKLGEDVERGGSPILLPAGWEIAVIAAPAGACPLAPTKFSNAKAGAYVFLIKPATQNCNWRAGDYHYVIRLKGLGGEILGSALGVFSIGPVRVN